MDIYGSKYVYNTNKQLLSNAGMTDKWLGIIYLQNCCLELYFHLQNNTCSIFSKYYNHLVDMW